MNCANVWRLVFGEWDVSLFAFVEEFCSFPLGGELQHNSFPAREYAIRMHT